MFVDILLYMYFNPQRMVYCNIRRDALSPNDVTNELFKLIM